MDYRYQEIAVELSKTIFEPGELISGKVCLNFEKEVECDKLIAHFIGGLQTKIINNDHSKEGSSSIYEYEKSFLNEIIILKNFKTEEELKENRRRESIGDWVIPFADIKPTFAPIKKNPESEFQGFEAGSHKIPFEFRLPFSGLYTSFSARKCNTTIKYGIIIELHRSNEVSHHTKADFSVVSPLPIPMELNLSKDFKSKIDLTKGFNIDITLTMLKRSYLPTEKLECQVTIKNSWKHSLKFVHFNIYQRMTSMAKLKTGNLRKTFISRIEHAGVGLPRNVTKIPAGQTYAFSPEFYIPALIPFPKSVEGIFTVEYFAQIKVGRDSSSIFGNCRAPISVGTHYATPIREEILVDLSTPPSSPVPTFDVKLDDEILMPTMKFSATNPFLNERFFVAPSAAC